MTPLTPEQRKEMLDKGLTEEEIQMVERNRAEAVNNDEGVSEEKFINAGYMSIIGKTEEVAMVLCGQLGLRARIVCIDGRHLIVTRDYRTDRVNLELKDGLVIKASLG